MEIMIDTFWYEGEEYEVEDVTEFTQTEEYDEFRDGQVFIREEEVPMVRIHLKNAPVESIEVESEQHQMLKDAYNE